MVSHGTLLLNSDLSHVSDALHVHENKIASKGIKSVRSRVANISEFLSSPMDIESFRDHLLKTYFEGVPKIPEFPLSTQDWELIHTLASERYRSWEWTYGHSPDFNIEKRQRFPGGEIDARLDVKQGMIQAAKFYGDFFSENEPEEIEKLLAGIRYERAEIESALKNVDIADYFSGLDLPTFSEFLY